MELNWLTSRLTGELYSPYELNEVLITDQHVVHSRIYVSGGTTARRGSSLVDWPRAVKLHLLLVCVAFVSN